MAKSYRCPYCEYRGDRGDLVSHVDETHGDMHPTDYSPAHIVFDLVNHKKPGDGGVCVVCKMPTPFNENAGKYDRLCGMKACREALRKAAIKNMIKVYNKPSLLDDPEHQMKMLKNRKISGKYRFTDGGYHDFTGKYESKCLEFSDKVMGFKSTEILSPGPTFEYEYKGKKLKWITDIYIIPFNLVIEVKDGGDNPNNREMVSYREKQIAKETMITHLGKFNYLRLTDNDFSQLLSTVAELKMQMIDDSSDNKKVVINIHEEVEALKKINILSEDFVKKEAYGNMDQSFEEFVALDEGVSTEPNISTPKELYAWMNKNISYGYLGKDGKIYKDGSENNVSTFLSQYKLQSPQELIKSGCGVCWDQAELERYFFDKMNIKNEIIFMIRGIRPDYPTHTYAILTINGEYFWFEHSWGKNKGIHGPFKSKQEIINKVHELDKKQNGEKEENWKAGTLTKPRYGMSCMEFMKFANKCVGYKMDKSTYDGDYIEENMGLAAVGGMPSLSNTFITQYGPAPTFVSDDSVEGYAMHNDILTDKVLTVDKNGNLTTKESSFLQGRKLRMFKYVGEDNTGYVKILKATNKRVYREFIYETLTGKRLLSDDQILCDEYFQEVNPALLYAKYTSEAQTIIDQYRDITGTKVTKLPLMDKEDIRAASDVLGSNTRVKIFENVNGYFAENAITRKRTAYFKNIEDIIIEVIL